MNSKCFLSSMDAGLKHGKLTRATSVLIANALLLSLLLTGCASIMRRATTPSKPPETFLAPDKKGSIRTIGVVIVGVPNLAMHAFEKEQKDRTASGVMVGAGQGIDAAIGPLGLLLLPLTVPLGAIIGGASAGADAIPAARAEEIAASVLPALSDFPFQESLVEQVMTTGSGSTKYDFRKVRSESAPYYLYEEADAILEVSMLSAGLSRVENGLQLVAIVRVQLAEKNTGTLLAQRTFSYAWRTFGRNKPEAGDEPLTREEIDGYLRVLSEDIVDALFLMEHYPQLFCAGVSGPPMFRYSEGLLPRNPKPDWGFFGTKYRSGKVDSLQPRLEWAPFPSKRDRETDTQGRLKGIGNVSYDLRIWRLAEEVQHPPMLVYERNGLADPWHTVEQPLENGKTYYWAVRARFVHDGHQAVTQWTTYHGVLPLITKEGTTTGKGSFFSALSGLYRFSTPALPK